MPTLLAEESVTVNSDGDEITFVILLAENAVDFGDLVSGTATVRSSATQSSAETSEMFPLGGIYDLGKVSLDGDADDNKVIGLGDFNIWFNNFGNRTSDYGKPAAGGGLTDQSGWTLATGDSFCYFGPCWAICFPAQGTNPLLPLWKRNDDIGDANNDLQSILLELTPFTADNRQYGETPRPKAGQDDGLGSPTQIGSIFVQWDGSTTQIDVTPGGDTFFLTFQNNSSGAGDYTTNKTGFSGASLVFGGGQAAASLVMAAAAESVMAGSVSGAVAVFAKSENITNVSRETIASTSRRTAGQVRASDRAVTQLTQPAHSDTAPNRLLRSGRTHRRVTEALLSVGSL